jgi:hypothetical protein
MKGLFCVNTLLHFFRSGFFLAKEAENPPEIYQIADSLRPTKIYATNDGGLNSKFIQGFQQGNITQFFRAPPRATPMLFIDPPFLKPLFPFHNDNPHDRH